MLLNYETKLIFVEWKHAYGSKIIEFINFFTKIWI